MDELTGTLTSLALPLQDGTVQRLNMSAGFGYVRDSAGKHAYIFLASKACSNAAFERLRVGSAVRFRVDEVGRVHNLQPVSGR